MAEARDDAERFNCSRCRDTGWIDASLCKPINGFYHFKFVRRLCHCGQAFRGAHGW